MRVMSQLLVAAVAMQMVLSGCGRRPGEDTGTTVGGTGTTSTQPSNSLSTVFKPPYPGDYKTVMVDGVEMRQGRFPQGEYGGTLVQSIIASDPKTFNPWVSADSSSSKLGALSFSSLMGGDAYTGDMYPDLAAEFKVEDDKITYTTRLRKGLKWSDGKPITAEDVAYTFNTIVAGGYGNTSIRDVISVAGQPPRVTVVDELTNKFVTAKPFAPFVRIAGSVPIAPKHVFEPITSGADGHRKFEQTWSQTVKPAEMVTSGPFRLARYVPSQRVEYERADNYYVVDHNNKRLPYLQKLSFLFVPDVSANLLKFKGKEIDLTQVRNRDAVELQREKDAGNFSLYNIGPDSGTLFVMFNMNPRKNKNGKPYVNPVKAKWFNDVNFRQAINHAINRERMVANYFKGIGSPLYTAESPVSPFHDTTLPAIPQNTEKAMQLLQQSGFTKKPDGNLYDKDGNRVEINLMGAAGGTLIPAFAGFIESDLKPLGIKVNTQLIEGNSLLNKVSESKDWEACIFAFTGDPLEPHNGANVWKSNGRLHIFDLRDPDGKGNIVVSDARPWEKEIDEIYESGVTEFDTEKRKEIYRKAERIVYEQAPFIYLANAMNILGARNTIQNFQPTGLSQYSTGLHNIDEVWMKGPAASSTAASAPASTKTGEANKGGSAGK